MKNQLAKRNNELFAAVEQVLNSCTESKRVPTASEKEQMDKMTAEIAENEKSIKLYEACEKGKAALNAAITEPFVPKNDKKALKGKQVLTAEYSDAFYSLIGNKKFSNTSNSALGEGGTTDGGNLVPTIGPDGAITALAPFEATMRKLALVIPTTNDIKFAAQSSKTTAAAKAESRGTDHPFTESSPAFAQKTLGAHMSGAFVEVTLELAQDVPAVSIFLPQDLARAVNNFEENIFINGSGSGEAEGILAGGTAAQTAALSGDAALDLTGSLNPYYYANAEFIMNRLTGIALRKKQLDANQYNPWWVSVNGVDYLHGFKVNYSHYMPAYQASPLVDGAVVFGDYKAAMVIGDRGGPALQIVTDNITRLENGIIRVYGYRRTDSRVRLPEAAQVWTVNG
ncbi:MAG TPA: phage major capsid protein [Terriglobales bacterium]|nr:phage major capsid protein [Terriglobales bacterium]